MNEPTALVSLPEERTTRVSGRETPAPPEGAGPVALPEGAGPVAPPAGEEHFRHSYSKDRALLLRRLARMEGQVRGIARMIEDEKYCIDILQQTAALRAAVDALAVLILEDHIRGCVRTAARRGEADAYAEEVLEVVRRALGRPVRSRTSEAGGDRPGGLAP
jgi:DNA-binding FrmR family transcriptional regulator